MSFLLALPSPSRHSGGCFLTVKLTPKYLLLGFEFLHNGSKVLHAGESNRMPERRPSILQSSLLRLLSKHAYRYPGELLGMNEQTAELDLDNYEKNEPASRPLVPLIYSYTRSVLCDFSEARFGEWQQGRYPAVSASSLEVISDIAWGWIGGFLQCWSNDKYQYTKRHTQAPHANLQHIQTPIM